MPYLLHPRGEGVEPGWAVVPEDYEPEAGEVLLQRRPEPGEVWALGKLRPKQAAELLSEARAEKLDDIAADAIAHLSGLFTEGKGRDEVVFLVAGHVLKICQALDITPDPRLSEVVATGTKAMEKKAQVEAATTVEELEGVGWT